jgi:hypothetical protein
MNTGILCSSVQIASPLSNLARVLTHQKRYREALLLQQRLVQLLRAHLPPAHPRLDVAAHHLHVRVCHPRPTKKFGVRLKDIGGLVT